MDEIIALYWIVFTATINPVQPKQQSIFYLDELKFNRLLSKFVRYLPMNFYIPVIREICFTQ